MQPSGLIFPVVIAIWATYLFQHWVRRREHVATARSVDRFSEAMRVLERRVPPPMRDLSAPQPRSYDVSPARASRPEVVVMRAQAPASKVPIPRRRTAALRMAALRSTRALHAPAGMSARRLRGLSLLASLSFAVVVVPMVAASVLPWWSLAVAAAALMVDAAWLRHAAVAERATRRARSSGHRTRPEVRPTATRTRSTARAARQPAARPPVRTEAAAAAAGVGEVAASAESPAGGSIHAGGVAGAGDLSGWSPVPVPPPTYTLKAKAERPEPVPAAVTERAPAQLSSFDGLVDQDELDGVLDRRAAGA